MSVSWTIKKAEHWRIDAFELWCWRRLLRVPWTARRSNQSILKEISPEYSLEVLMLKLKLQYFGHLLQRYLVYKKLFLLFSCCHIQLLVTPWTAAHQAPLSFTISQSLLKLMSIEWCYPTISSLVVPFSSCLQSFPASGSFLMSQLFISGDQSIGASTSASVLPINIQGWFPLELTGLISLQSRGLSKVFSNTTIQKHQFFGAQLSL